MLDINWSDVMSLLEQCKSHLIAIGVILAVLIAILIATRKTAQPLKTRLRGHGLVAGIIGILVAVNLMLTGPLDTILTLASGSGTINEETQATSEELGEQIASEGIVLFKNDDAVLPLKGQAVNVFGWDSAYPVYGGMGSGALSDAYPIVDLIAGLENAGIQTNHDLTAFYQQYASERPAMNIFAQDWTLPEPPVSTYPEELLSSAEAFSDTAIIVIGRVGGENIDIPQSMAGMTYTENSSDYADFPEGTTYLELSQTERDLLEMVASTYDNVIFVYNGANTIQLDFLKDIENIDAVVWVPGTGQNGFDSFGKILAGEVNPSGRATDTFLYDNHDAPSFNSMQVATYDNMSEFQIPDSDQFVPGALPHFVTYSEGIYVGYRFFETAAEEGLIDYDEVVAFPFGSGLSYTTFSQEMGELVESDGRISVSVSVTNTGSVAGKEVVQLYVNPPYTDGGIEKASANLVDYGKTKLLEPGESQTIELSVAIDDLASYDTYGAGCYVLEAGDYVFSINENSHTAIDSKTYTVAETITYDEGNARSSELIAATNRFGAAEGAETIYLSREGGFANYAEATAPYSNFSMPESDKALFVNNSNYVLPETDAEMPTTGASNGLTLADMRGLDYDDPQWDALLDQASIPDMVNMVALGGYSTAAMDSVGKLQTVDCDGPASINNNFTGVGSIGFPCGTMIANTFNKELAYSFGERIGQMADEMGVSGWYAPAVNIHRSAYAGRNFEYYSEDPYLAGTIANEAIKGAASHGVYAYLKHFALNEVETYRWQMLCTWSNEQAIREIYLKPFQIAITDSAPGAIMSSYNYIGPIWAGANSALLQDVLREEWGYKGFVLTDYFANFGYMDATRSVMNGGSNCLATYDTGSNFITATDNPAVVSAMRDATHHVLYTAVNSRAYAAENMVAQTPLYRTILTGANVVVAALLAAFEWFHVRKKVQEAKVA